ncbi:glycosyltransferase family 4 protein [Xenorhabdus sp. KK7.4]|uniref:glycosyltransferase family 4 protein n=1 Tax=Xenorhabdus sp. KK7.4 TaxID=1851572 RepID=UPI000C04D3AE|nr:glycosyltransferase family 4 protein [Xenorhabdus sp. KK7.4]PHM58630.1 putative lipopolysaccharide biosynthesis protein [Xenorhabdus sp. KK7.4]
MKVIHLINLQGFGGVEKRFVKYIRNSHNENIIYCLSNTIDENVASTLSGIYLNMVNRVFNSYNLKWPAFIRKYILTFNINRLNADCVIVWDLVPKLLIKPKCRQFIYYDCGCGWRYALNNKTFDFLNMVDAVISNSHASARVMQLRYSFRKKIVTVLNRLDMQPVLIPKQSINEKNITLGTASRLVGLKGISVSILVLHELKRRGIIAKLLIAGSGDCDQQLRELAFNLSVDDQIDFLGYQSDMKAFYEKIDLYMSTPATEAFGLSCIEALSNSVPVIFPLVDGQPEAVKDGYCGIGLKPTISIEEHKKLTGIDINFPHQVYDPINDQLTEPKLLSHIDCADAIERLLKDPSLYESMSRNAIEWSKESMNYEKFLHEFEDALSSLAKPALPRK